MAGGIGGGSWRVKMGREGGAGGAQCPMSNKECPISKSNSKRPAGHPAATANFSRAAFHWAGV